MQRKAKENSVSSWGSGPTPYVDSRLNHWEAPLSQISLNVSMSQTLTVWTPPYLSHTHTCHQLFHRKTQNSQAHSCPSPTKTTKGSKWPHRRQRKSLQGEEGENLDKEVIFSLLNCLGASVENQLTINIRGYFWTFCFIPFVYVYLYGQYHTALIMVA